MKIYVVKFNIWMTRKQKKCSPVNIEDKTMEKMFGFFFNFFSVDLQKHFRKISESPIPLFQ